MSHKTRSSTIIGIINNYADWSHYPGTKVLVRVVSSEGSNLYFQDQESKTRFLFFLPYVLDVLGSK